MKTKVQEPLQLRKLYSDWSNKRKKQKEKEYGIRYNLQALSLKEQASYYRKRLSVLKDEIQEISCEIFTLWQASDYSTTFFYNSGIFYQAEENFISAHHPSLKLQDIPEEEHYSFMEFRSELWDDQIAEYRRRFIMFIEKYDEFQYVSSLLSSLISEDTLSINSGNSVNNSSLLPEDKLLTRQEAAEYLGISIQTLDRRRKQKMIKSIDDGGTVRLRKSDLDNYLLIHIK